MASEAGVPFSTQPTTRPLFGLVQLEPMGRRPAPARGRHRCSSTSGRMATRPTGSPPDPRGRATANRDTNAQRCSGQRNPRLEMTRHELTTRGGRHFPGAGVETSRPTLVATLPPREGWVKLRILTVGSPPRRRVQVRNADGRFTAYEPGPWGVLDGSATG
jgi:hypothetical protein